MKAQGCSTRTKKQLPSAAAWLIVYSVLGTALCKDRSSPAECARKQRAEVQSISGAKETVDVWISGPSATSLYSRAPVLDVLDVLDYTADIWTTSFASAPDRACCAETRSPTDARCAQTVLVLHLAVRGSHNICISTPAFHAPLWPHYSPPSHLAPRTSHPPPPPPPPFAHRLPVCRTSDSRALSPPAHWRARQHRGPPGCGRPLQHPRTSAARLAAAMSLNNNNPNLQPPFAELEPEISNPVKRIRWATHRATDTQAESKRHSLKERLHRRIGSGEKRDSLGKEGGSLAGLGPDKSPGSSDAGHDDDDSGRRVYFNLPLPPSERDEDNHPIHSYARNKIRTAKYTPISFVPKNLWFQFHNIANIYFLFIIILGVRTPSFPREWSVQR